ncbi:MAG: hypothetical protein ACYCW6_15725 [Candidatus Xenobia bacterium]
MRHARALALLLLLALPASAQMVVVDQDYTVTRVDLHRSQIVVAPVGEQARNDDMDVKSEFAVLIGGHTQVLDSNGRVRRWQDIKPGMDVHVQGGLNWLGKIEARKIVMPAL